MVEKFVRQREYVEKDGLDLSLFRKRGNSKTYKGYLIQKMKEARQEGNFEVAELIQHFYKKCLEFETDEKICLSSWKGKSGIKVIEEPDKFIISTFQKADQDSITKEVKREINKMEVNEVINTINKLDKKEPIPTSDIAEMVYRRAWKDVFSDRHTHTQLNLILRLLDYYKITVYRAGKSKVINKVKEIQTNLLIKNDNKHL